MIDILSLLIILPSTPVGFLLVISLIIYLEYRVIRSIAEDKNAARLNKMILRYVHNRKSRYTLMAVSQWKVLDKIFKKTHMTMQEALERTKHIKVGFSNKIN